MTNPNLHSMRKMAAEPATRSKRTEYSYSPRYCIFLFPTILILSIAAVVLCAISLTQETRAESQIRLARDYEQCDCLLHNWYFPPLQHTVLFIVEPDPIVNMTLYCPSDIYETIQEISVKNGNLRFITTANQTCYRPHDSTNILRLGVPNLGWSDAPHYSALAFGFSMGIIGILFAVFINICFLQCSKIPT